MAVDDERVRMSVPNADRLRAFQVWMVGIESIMDVDDDALILARRL